MRVTVIGAGVSGLVTATALCERGAEVTVLERAPELGANACSWLAGGMLAPWCERESAEAAVAERGQAALAWWPAHFAGTVRQGTLVVAPARDAADLQRFARRTDHFTWVDQDVIADLEPDLAGRFRRGLFFADEAHLDPRVALAALAADLGRAGASVRFDVDADTMPIEADRIVDCRGYAARGTLPGLRGVRGEMIVVRAPDVALSRPVRLLHPRIPLYVVPRNDHRFMIGATMIESDSRGPMTVRSAMELLNAAFTLHPAFAEAEILEFGADVRPAFADNMPRVQTVGRTIHVNGMFRHGFLLSPSCAAEVRDLIMQPQELAA